MRPARDKFRYRLRQFLDRPVEPRRPVWRDLGRLSVFVFGVLVVTGVLLALYYRASPESAFQSLTTVTNSVHFGWLVRSLHRVAGHALVALSALYVVRGFFRRLFLRPRGGGAWAIAVCLAFVSLAFLLTGESLPWNQHAYWQTVVNANLIAELPFGGRWMANVFRGGPEVTGLTLVRLFAIHVLILPWVAFGLLLAARELRRRGELA